MSGQRAEKRTKSRKAFEDMCANRGYEPGALALAMVLDELPCSLCSKSGKVDPMVFARYTNITAPKVLEIMAKDAENGEMVHCPVCNGRGFEQLDPTARLAADREILRIIVPAVRPVEVTGEVRHRLTVSRLAVADEHERRIIDDRVIEADHNDLIDDDD